MAQEEASERRGGEEPSQPPNLSKIVGVIVLRIEIALYFYNPTLTIETGGSGCCSRSWELPCCNTPILRTNALSLSPALRNPH